MNEISNIQIPAVEGQIWPNNRLKLAQIAKMLQIVLLAYFVSHNETAWKGGLVWSSRNLNMVLAIFDKIDLDLTLF